MKLGIIIWSTIAIFGVAAAIFGHLGHLYFTALPGAALALSEYAEYRRERKRKTQSQ